MKIRIIDYKAGNIRSVLFAMERLGVNAELTDDAEELRTADKVIFPGVGEASSAMQKLKERGLDKVIQTLTQPVLGICLGMQLLCDHSEEGNVNCLGLIPQRVRKFDNSKDSGVKVPHIGWNEITILQDNLYKGVNDKSYQYYVHSYYVEKGAYTTGISDYLLPFSASLKKNNFYGVQFHPEKGAEVGARILKNFIEL